MKVAYSPILPLIKSHVAIYKIYVLKNPLKENEIFYVGQTFKELEERLIGHINESESNQPKVAYIKQIIENGSKPIIESIEVINGTCYADRLMVNERELYWIKYYKALGFQLLNAAGTKDNAYCYEYKNYLSSLKRGETSWHYYYCGKTRNGDEVYDEKRLNMDGFSFPKETPTFSHSTEDRYYNPWENERFLKMIQRSGSGDRIYYDKSAYKDMDSNFYDDDY